MYNFYDKIRFTVLVNTNTGRGRKVEGGPFVSGFSVLVTHIIIISISFAFFIYREFTQELC